MGWQIFVHSFRQVFGNLGGALRVSALLTIVQVGVMMTIGKEMMVDQETMMRMMQTGAFPWGRMVIVWIVLLVTWLWIAVGWHRFVLLEEEASVVPPLRVDRMLGYLGKSILITLLLMVVAVPLGMVAGMLIGPMLVKATSGGAAIFALGLFALVVYLPLAVIGLRLSSVLPGVALEPGMPLFKGWEATRGQTGTILILAVILVAFSIGLQYLASLAFTDPFSLPAIVVNGIVQWFVGMVGVSILTTLYGHFVEGRPLRV